MDKYLDMTDDQIDGLLFNLGTSENSEEKPKSDIKTKQCPFCQSTKIGNDGNIGTVCLDCGGEISEIFETNPQFEGDEGHSASYGCPSSYFFPKSALGTKLKIKGYSRISNLQKQGQMPYKEKSLLDVMDGIQQKCKKYNLTQKVIDTAKILYKKINDAKHTKGERKGKSVIMRCVNRRSMIAACVFYACKLEDEPRSPKEIADIYDLEVKHVNRGCRRFLDFIDIHSYFNKVKCSQAVDFIMRYSDKLNLSEDIIDKAVCVAENIHKLDAASTHEPPSVAAGSILLVCNLLKIDINKKSISEIFEISDVTISKTYRKIFPYHKIVMNYEVSDYIKDKIVNFEKNTDTINLENIIVKEIPQKRIPKKKKEIVKVPLQEPQNKVIIKSKKSITVDL